MLEEVTKVYILCPKKNGQLPNNRNSYTTNLHCVCEYYEEPTTNSVHFPKQGSNDYEFLQCDFNLS